MALLDDIKLALRISETAFDSEISEIIESAKLDMFQSGAKNTTETDPLVKRAIILYAKANFGMANPDMEKYAKAYDKLKTMLSMSVEYGDANV